MCGRDGGTETRELEVAGEGQASPAGGDVASVRGTVTGRPATEWEASLPRGPVTYNFIEVGKTLYGALGAEIPRSSAYIASHMLRELPQETQEETILYDPSVGLACSS